MFFYAAMKKKRRPDPRIKNGTARRKLRERVRRHGLPCHICGRPIDYSLKWPHPLAYELDEIIPVAKGGDPLDPENVAPSHRICNERKSDKMPQEMAKAHKEPTNNALQW